MTYWPLWGTRWDSRSWLTWRSFVNSILQGGLPPCQTDNHGYTPVDNIVKILPYIEQTRRQMGIDICSDMLTLGGHISPKYFDLKVPIPFSRKGHDFKASCLFGHWKHKEFSPLNTIWKLADENGILGKYRPISHKHKLDLTL